MDYRESLARLTSALQGPLPGPRVHPLLTSLPRPGWTPGEVPGDARPAGVLLLIYPRRGEPHLPLTVRTEDVETHRGQISLPGGALDENETPETGALREAEEEVGVPAGEVRLVGRLTPLFIPPSRFVVHPVVGALDRPPVFRPAPAEVARIIEAPLVRLGAPGAVRRESRDGRTRIFFTVEGQEVWGATAMILAELLALLGFHPWDSSGGSVAPGGLDGGGGPR